MNKKVNSPICDVYSIDRIKKIIGICFKNPNYRVIVSCSSFREMAILFADIPTEYLIPVNGIRVLKDQTKIVFEFDNNSIIEFIVCNENFLGRRIHALLYTNSAYYDNIKNILIPMLIDYHIQKEGD